MDSELSDLEQQGEEDNVEYQRALTEEREDVPAPDDDEQEEEAEKDDDAMDVDANTNTKGAAKRGGESLSMFLSLSFFLLFSVYHSERGRGTHNRKSAWRKEKEESRVTRIHRCGSQGACSRR